MPTNFGQASRQRYAKFLAGVIFDLVQDEAPYKAAQFTVEASGERIALTSPDLAKSFARAAAIYLNKTNYAGTDELLRFLYSLHGRGFAPHEAYLDPRMNEILRAGKGVWHIERKPTACNGTLELTGEPLTLGQVLQRIDDSFPTKRVTLGKLKDCIPSEEEMKAPGWASLASNSARTLRLSFQDHPVFLDYAQRLLDRCPDALSSFYALATIFDAHRDHEFAKRKTLEILKQAEEEDKHMSATCLDLSLRWSEGTWAPAL